MWAGISPSLPTTWGGRLGSRSEPSRVGSLLRVRLRLAFLDEEHRDPVDDRIEDLAVRAPELVRLLQLQLGVAPRAGQNLQ